MAFDRDSTRKRVFQLFSVWIAVVASLPLLHWLIRGSWLPQSETEWILMGILTVTASATLITSFFMGKPMHSADSKTRVEAHEVHLQRLPSVRRLLLITGVFAYLGILAGAVDDPTFNSIFMAAVWPLLWGFVIYSTYKQERKLRDYLVETQQGRA